MYAMETTYINLEFIQYAYHLKIKIENLWKILENEKKRKI